MPFFCVMLVLALVGSGIGARTVSIAVAGTPGPDAERGIVLGIDEARQTARLLGIELRRVDRTAAAPALLGIVDAGDAPTRLPAGVPVVRLTADGDERRNPCTFTVAALPATRSAALRMWRQQGHPEAANAQLVEWDPSLTRYGASEVNERFEHRFGTRMTPDGWRGWMAVKALADAGLRAAPGSDRCRALAEARIDGHKGRALTFDRRTGELSQPLYVVSGRHGTTTVLGEIEP